MIIIMIHHHHHQHQHHLIISISITTATIIIIIITIAVSTIINTKGHVVHNRDHHSHGACERVAHEGDVDDGEAQDDYDMGSVIMMMVG
eukprot:12414741-Karenia_brevis.AAC.1